MATSARLARRPKARPAARKAPRPQLEVIREAVADYMRSEGCGCCSDTAAHSKHANRLGELLNVPKYPDGSGHDFKPFRSKR